MRKIRFFDGKSILVLGIIALAFYTLWQSRFNDALPEGFKAERLEFRTLDNQSFTTDEIGMPVMLVFLNTKTFFTSNIYPNLILKAMPELKQIENAGYMKLLVVTDIEQTPESVHKLLGRKKYKILENSVYLSNTELLSGYFGVRSWPHFFLMDKDNTILYQDKVPSVDKLIRILKGV